MRILVVDDCAEMRALIGRFLREGGFEDIAEEASAESAYRRIGLTAPIDCVPDPVDVILMDIQLPGESGIEVCRRLKAYERFRDLPVLMVTASTDMELLRDSFEAGACDYLNKPILRTELLVRVKAAARLKQAMEARKAREREILEQKKSLERANRKLEHLAGVDALTGIANRRRFEEVYTQEWLRAQRTNSALSLVLIDIDDFKGYNDTYGHQQGDDCLQAVAQALASTARRSADLVARYGGEEFAVILPGLDQEEALDVAQRLRQAVAKLHIAHEASPVADCLTVSVGVATAIPAPERPQKELVARADEALYRSKTAGRDRVTAEGDIHPQASARTRHANVAGAHLAEIRSHA
jgi:diguanylate cyclase (GGDEF)-like protein